MDEQDALIASLTATEQGVTRIRDVAHKLWRCNAVSRVWKLAESLYAQPECEKRMCAVFLFGMLAVEDAHALAVLRDDVAQDGNWRVQEVLAQAFDYYCRETGYKRALPTIKAWLKAPSPNTRRAVTEGLRVWTKRPYFNDHPEVALALLKGQVGSDSEYLRRSARNALSDLRRTRPELAADL